MNIFQNLNSLEISGMIITPTTLNMVKFPCGICQRLVATKRKTICCDLCNKWIHIGSNNLNKTSYIQIQHSDTTWFCMPCLKNEVPFNTLTNHELEKVYNGKHILSITSKNTQNFTKNLNSFLQDETNNKIHSLYYDIADFNKMVTTYVKIFSLLHLNVSSLPYHFEEFDELLNSLHIKFDVIRITESRLKLNVLLLVNINLKNYNNEETPTELGKGGTLLYVSSDINYKVRKELNIYEAKELNKYLLKSLIKIEKIVLLDAYANTPKCQCKISTIF